MIYRDEFGRFAKRPADLPDINVKDHQALINRMIEEMELAIRGKLNRLDRAGYSIVRKDKPVAYWAAVDEDGYVTHSNNQACHAALSYEFYKKEPLYIASRIQHGNNPRPLDPAIMSVYLDWLINRSPYSDSFVNKMSGQDTLALGYVVVRTNIPSNMLAGALIAARMLTEHAGAHPFIWHHLVKAGVSEDLAFPFSFLVDCSDHKNISFVPKIEWHSCWNGKCFDRKMVENFINRTPPNLNPLYNSGAHRYAPVCNMWGNPKGDWYRVPEDIADEMKAKAGEKISCNPFKKAELKASIPVVPFCEIWAQRINKEFANDA